MGARGPGKIARLARKRKGQEEARGKFLSKRGLVARPDGAEAGLCRAGSDPAHAIPPGRPRAPGAAYPLATVRERRRQGPKARRLARTALAAGLGALSALAPSRGARGEERPVISEIVIRREDVFSPSDAGKAFVPYGLANALHVVTRETFIRRELLLSPGDPLDPELLAEAERRLRATQLFRHVDVRAEGTRVIVETGDNWTLIPRVAFSSKGGKVTYQFGIEEGNLFGSGRRLSFRYDKETERISRSLTWYEPQLLGSRWALRVSASDLSDGQSTEVSLARPFDSLLTPAAGSFLFRQATFETKQYAGGEEVAAWEKDERRIELEGGFLLGAHGERADRLVVFGGPEKIDLSAGSFGPPPPADGRSFFWFGGGLQREARDWIVRQNHDQLGRDEDFNLAPVARVDVAVSPGGISADAAGRVRVGGSAGALVGKGFTIGTVGFETRLDGGLQNARLSASVRGWWPVGPALLAAHVGWRQAWNPDPEYQIQLDGQNGVRGYPLYAVTGEGNVTANAELRAVLVPDVLRLAVLGAAVFVDGGVSWGDPDGWYRLLDAGLGLRIGLPRAGRNTLLRVDLARAFRPDPQGRTGWLLSFSSAQAF